MNHRLMSQRAFERVRVADRDSNPQLRALDNLCRLAADPGPLQENAQRFLEQYRLSLVLEPALEPVLA